MEGSESRSRSLGARTRGCKRSSGASAVNAAGLDGTPGPRQLAEERDAQGMPRLLPHPDLDLCLHFPTTPKFVPLMSPRTCHPGDLECTRHPKTKERALVLPALLTFLLSFNFFFLIGQPVAPRTKKGEPRAPGHPAECLSLGARREPAGGRCSSECR